MNPQNVWKPIEPAEERWEPKHPAPASDPLIVDKSRSTGKSVLMVGANFGKSETLRRQVAALLASDHRLFIIPQHPPAEVLEALRAERSREADHWIFRDELADPETVRRALARQRGVILIAQEANPLITAESILAARESLMVEPPDFQKIIPERMELTADTNASGEIWADLSERGARRPRGFAKAKGWKAKQRAKRKAQRQARQRGRR